MIKDRQRKWNKSVKNNHNCQDICKTSAKHRTKKAPKGTKRNKTAQKKERKLYITVLYIFIKRYQCTTKDRSTTSLQIRMTSSHKQKCKTMQPYKQMLAGKDDQVAWILTSVRTANHLSPSPSQGVHPDNHNPMDFQLLYIRHCLISISITSIAAFVQSKASKSLAYLKVYGSKSIIHIVYIHVFVYIYIYR